MMKLVDCMSQRTDISVVNARCTACECYCQQATPSGVFMYFVMYTLFVRMVFIEVSERKLDSLQICNKVVVHGCSRPSGGGCRPKSSEYDSSPISEACLTKNSIYVFNYIFVYLYLIVKFLYFRSPDTETSGDDVLPNRH